MPSAIDLEARLRNIADVTVTIAKRDGIQGVSYRSVAREIGGSTNLVTHYLPTRAALLQNALRHMSLRRDQELCKIAAAAAPGQKLVAVAEWSCTTDPDDMIFRRMLIHAVAELVDPAELLNISDDQRPSLRETLREAALGDGHPNPVDIADALVLLSCGFSFAAVQNAEVWTEQRAAAVIHALVGSRVDASLDPS